MPSILFLDEAFLCQYLTNYLKNYEVEDFVKIEIIETIEIITELPLDAEESCMTTVTTDFQSELNPESQKICLLDEEKISKNVHVKSDQFDKDLFISLVQEKPPIYNFKLPLQKRSKHIKEYLWAEIRYIMKTSLCVDDLAKKWKALYDYFRRIKNRYKDDIVVLGILKYRYLVR